MHLILTCCYLWTVVLIIWSGLTLVFGCFRWTCPNLHGKIKKILHSWHFSAGLIIVTFTQGGRAAHSVSSFVFYWTQRFSLAQVLMVWTNFQSCCFGVQVHRDLQEQSGWSQRSDRQGPWVPGIHGDGSARSLWSWRSFWWSNGPGRWLNGHGLQQRRTWWS